MILLFFLQPLSELSVDSIDPNGLNIMTNSNNTLTRFHRSLSMGQGWAPQATGSGTNGNNRYIFQHNIDALHDQASKVVLRRRNNSTCEGIVFA